jgi:hypothetical protein
LIGGSLLLFFPTGAPGLALFAPIIASKLINAFSTITLAHVLGATMGIIGHGVGTIIGLPLDLAYHLLCKVCVSVGGYYYREYAPPIFTGIRISDGVVLINGIAVTIMPVEKLTEIHSEKIIELKIELKEDGSLYINGKGIITAQDGIQLPPIVIEELKEYIKNYSTAKIEEPKIPKQKAVLVENAGQDTHHEPGAPFYAM